MVEVKIKCPVCGIDVNDNSEFKISRKGETYYFCSEEDKKEFQAHPPIYSRSLEPPWNGWRE